MQRFFRELFEYNRQKNTEIADLCANNQGAVSEKALRLFSHTLNAHHIWNKRMSNSENLYGVWDLHIINSWDTIDHHNFEDSVTLLKKVELSDSFMYKDSKGESFQNTFRDIFFHLINHSNYHRAQIITELRYEGLEPARTDFIYYKR